MASVEERIAVVERDNEHLLQQISKIVAVLEKLPAQIKDTVRDEIAHCRMLQRPPSDGTKNERVDNNAVGLKAGWVLAICQGVWIFAKSKGWV